MTIPTTLKTRRGEISLPAYAPVTTFGERYPLDGLIRPYLPRLAKVAMVSFHYAQKLRETPWEVLPLMIDSGGFACLFEGARLEREGQTWALAYEREGEAARLTAGQVLAFQEQHADVAFTLDFPIPPGLDEGLARERQEATIANAVWAIENRRSRSMLLYACIQGWDVDSVRACARAYAGHPFDGVALGGLVPRAQNEELVLAMVAAVRDELPSLPIHAFGMGRPEMVGKLFRAGVQSVDSSSYVKLAVEGRSWSDPTLVVEDPSPMDRMGLALGNLAVATQARVPMPVLPSLSRFVSR